MDEMEIRPSHTAGACTAPAKLSGHREEYCGQSRSRMRTLLRDGTVFVLYSSLPIPTE
jgi:hypothetical protein